MESFILYCTYINLSVLVCWLNMLLLYRAFSEFYYHDANWNLANLGVMK
jgi:hypothetical protein